MCYTNRYMYHYICSGGHALFFQLHYRLGKEAEVSSSFFIVLITIGVILVIKLRIYMTVQKKKFRVSALLFGISIIIEFSPFKNSLFVRLVRLILVATSFYKTTKKIVRYINYFSHFTFLS